MTFYVKILVTTLIPGNDWSYEYPSYITPIQVK